MAQTRALQRLASALVHQGLAHHQSRVSIAALSTQASSWGRNDSSRPGEHWKPLLGVSVLGFALGTAVTANADEASTQAPKPDPYKRPAQAGGLPPSFTLYQYEVCPFCCKVKAMLDYYKLPYHVIEVNPLTKSEISWSSYKKVPILKWDDQSGTVETDSSVIMSRLATELTAKTAPKPPPGAPKATPAPTGRALEEEERWRRWVDERFVKVITANIYRSWDESVDTFKYITTQTNWSLGTRELARWSGAVLMWQIGKRMPAKYNITGDLRDALYADCNTWVETIGPKRPFLGGSAPGLADLAVYGVLKAVQHTMAFSDAMANSKIKPWYDRMEKAIGTPSRIPDAAAA